MKQPLFLNEIFPLIKPSSQFSFRNCLFYEQIIKIGFPFLFSLIF